MLMCGVFPYMGHFYVSRQMSSSFRFPPNFYDDSLKRDSFFRFRNDTWIPLVFTCILLSMNHSITSSMHSSVGDFTSTSGQQRFGEILAEISLGGRRDSMERSNSGKLPDSGGDIDGDEGAFDDDSFGTPEEEICRQQRAERAKKAAQVPPSAPCTVMDACIACDEEALCDILRKGVTKAALNKKHPKTGRVSFSSLHARKNRNWTLREMENDVTCM